ncbi:ABC transporter permease [Acetanaerobacterium elongatum]|uniref:ABC-2 type transport system permease protein n=1 Tax=Acetanaerobacterium elongatum TaxID=258515 RepID=A0A1H0C1R5_9FIRM|nr:ABC-2 family transporter protein [Acetanaerobacterium elongatum]SDN51785.1 ABC-2 type transport system permease protein [Acetanaerobacterium elongatum]
MKSFFEVIKLEIKEDVQYTFGFMISVAVQPIIMLINIALFTSLYSYNGAETIKGYDLGQMIWYFTATHFIWVIVFNFTDHRISERILSGELAMDMLRPMDLFTYELGLSIGLRITALFTELLPGLLVYSLIYFPSFMSLPSVLKFICTVLMAFVLMYMINFLAGLFAFILKSNAAVTGIKTMLMMLLGGSYIPLEFYPQLAVQILAFLPFEYIFYWPIQFFLNTAASNAPGAFIRVLAIQAAWIVVLYGLCRLCWRQASRHFCAVG